MFISRSNHQIPQPEGRVLGWTPRQLGGEKSKGSAEKEQSMKKAQKNHIDNKQEFLHLAAKILLLGSCVGLAIGGIFYAWSVLAGKVQPDTTAKFYTELYFEDYTRLPSKVTPQHQYFFKFTLHNLENKDMEYPYEMYAVLGQGKFVIFDKGTVLVKKNEYKTIQEGFDIDNTSLPRSEIVVNLINKKQQIDFWIEGGS
jgi:hypothetical protein